MSAGGGGGGAAGAIWARRPCASSSIEPEQSRTNTTSWAPSSGTPKNSTTGAPTSSTTGAGGGTGTRTSARTAARTVIATPAGGRGTKTVQPTQTSSRETSDNGRMSRPDLATKAIAAALVATVPAGCVRQLPPAPTPQAIVPALGATPPPAGQGRLVVDVVDGPTPVQRVQIGSEPIPDPQGRVSYRLFEAPQLLCPASPCVADLPPGNVLLGFPVIGSPDALEVELVHVGPETSIYRRALSVREDHTGALRTVGIVSTSVGSVSAITGIVLLPIGLSDDSDGLTTAGALTLGIGAAVMAFGIWAIRRDAPTFRPGAANHFTP